MAEREIMGFKVRATTEPEEPGAVFYEPAFRIRRIGEKYEHPHVCYAVSQDVERRTQEEALRMAETELGQITDVIWNGDIWDIQS
ncbi:hypothetical protein JAK58_09360 [Stenotrophomonas maltophilia]|uniref:hypothetical protein n=1 Tax=Stenotrophomonas maltophilia TaxID=40324 RepID=UPI0021C570F7|nr:hypothetical protein [Stenotrophomonas maltophilia]MCU1091716.1 hypothetical protein [Stenotrophomonas maltophilia]